MTQVLKPQAPFERLKFANSCPETALRKAIILQAIIDASGGVGKDLAAKASQDAFKWLFNNSEGFIETCINADLDPDFVVKISKQLLGEHKAKQKKSNKKQSKMLDTAHKPLSKISNYF